MINSDAESTTSLLACQHEPSRETEILINVYDLLPTSRLADFLWHIGAGVTHSGVVINDREWAFGAHEQPGTTGVFYCPPGTVPPGGTFRYQILQGTCNLEDEDIHAVLQEARTKFLGTDWSLLRNNCNHFTSFLCERLTGKPAPSYLNRAASIASGFGCLLPVEQLIEAPAAEIVDPRPVVDLCIEDDDEQVHMLKENHGFRSQIDQEDHHVYVISDQSETDDSLKAKWRRRRRKYRRHSWREPAALFDDAGRPIPAGDDVSHHRHFREVIVNHRGRRLRYRIRNRGHRMHLALIEARLRRHPEWSLDLLERPHLPENLCTVYEEAQSVDLFDDMRVRMHV